LLSPEPVLKGGGCVEDYRSRKGQQAKGAPGTLDKHRSDQRHSALAGVGWRDHLYRIVADDPHLRLVLTPFLEPRSDPRALRRAGSIAASKAYSGIVISGRRQHRAWELITASALLFTLLLVLLPHPHHLTVAAACPVLAVMFLFGAVCVAYSLLLLSQASDEHLPQSPALPTRFQRPPPASL
jgi:hypothetical protein